MSDRLAMAALRFATNIEKLDEVADIIEALHEVARLAGLNALGAWRLPPWARRDDRRSYSICVHPSVPASFYPEFWDGYQQHGRSFLANLAWRNRGPFTMTEALRIVKPTGTDRWLQFLLYKYGIRDLFYVPNGDTMVVYWAPKLLRLDAPTRAVLHFAATVTAARLHRVFGRLGKEADPGLSSRQRAALRLLADGYTTAEIAVRLEIAHGTVKEHIERAVKKLGAKNQINAVAEAMRRYVVIGLGLSAACAAIFEIYDICCWDVIDTLIEMLI